MKLIIEDDEGRKTVVPLVRDEITIGRQEGNTIRLTERNVSRRHARLLRQGTNVFIEDLGSYTGVRVNGDKIQARTSIKEGDLIEIGDYDLNIQGAPEASTAPAARADDDATVPDTTSPGARPRNGANGHAREARGEEDSTSPGTPAPDTGGGGSSNAATAIVRLSDLNKGGPMAAKDVKEIPKNQAPRLVGIAGALRGKEFWLLRTEMKVGRTDENDIQIDHQSMSRQHCRFQRGDDGAWKILDNKSANGVRVNGEDYQVSAVRNGDTVELGHVKFKFVGPGQSFQLPPETNARPAAAEENTSATVVAKKNNLPVIIGGVVALALIAVLAIFLLKGKGGGGEPASGSGDAQALVKEGQKAIMRDDYVGADEAFQKAQAMEPGIKIPQAPHAHKEAANQASYKAMLDCIDHADFDCAYDNLQKVEGDSSFATKAKSREGEITRGKVDAHLNKAKKALDAKDASMCIQEASEVQLVDPSNIGAKVIIDQCNKLASDTGQAIRPAQPHRAQNNSAPAERKVAEAPPAPAHAAPAAPAASALSQDDRDSKASELVQGANAKILKGDFEGGIHDLQQAVILKPSTSIIAKAYRSLGVIQAKQGNMAQAAHYYELYLPLCTNPSEKGYLQKMLDDYHKQNGGK